MWPVDALPRDAGRIDHDFMAQVPHCQEAECLSMVFRTYETATPRKQAELRKTFGDAISRDVPHFHKNLFDAESGPLSLLLAPASGGDTDCIDPKLQLLLTLAFECGYVCSRTQPWLKNHMLKHNTQNPLCGLHDDPTSACGFFQPTDRTRRFHGSHAIELLQRLSSSDGVCKAPPLVLDSKCDPEFRQEKAISLTLLVLLPPPSANVK